MKLTKIKYLVDLYQGGGGLQEVTHNPPTIKEGKLNIHFLTSYTMKSMKRRYSVDLYQGGGGLGEVTHNSPITKIEYFIFGKLINETNEI